MRDELVQPHITGIILQAKKHKIILRETITDYYYEQNIFLCSHENLKKSVSCIVPVTCIDIEQL
jgi:hypothetical protein